eukprot:TRINITY_DN7901_c0_g1_i3.p1 TRINITY_DN7901_c0_g1~~TRINITY_DN7901_c0_g1_i3.p1  ORF type:complete len:387 (+),score=60.29 TRINITY_DN7901_c0_g1_i3:179-1339(+)
MIAIRCLRIDLAVGVRWLSSSRSCSALKTGLVGLPNVGKSSLFNALVGDMQAQAANYAFCTIDPNIGTVSVPDERLEALAALSRSQKIISTILQFVDIAGLIAGSSKGEGLGNKFLANVRECDVIVHVVRAFENDNITHVSNRIDPANDIGVIDLELLLADLQQVDNALTKTRRGQVDPVYKRSLDKLKHSLDDGIKARHINLTKEEKVSINHLGLLTLKPVLYAINAAEDDVAQSNAMITQVQELAREDGAESVVVSAAFESELTVMTEEDKELFLAELDLSPIDTGLVKLVQKVYRLLDLISFFTTGPQETRAWTVTNGALAPQAAGKIHSDFEKHFIKADVIDWQQLIAAGGFSTARDQGLIRLEGKDYLVQDGDVMVFKTSA